MAYYHSLKQFLMDYRGKFATLFFNETTTHEVEKSMDAYLAYWSPTVQTIVSKKRNLDPALLLHCSIDTRQSSCVKVDCRLIYIISHYYYNVLVLT